MRLNFAAPSPFVRKVMMVLHETDQLGDVEIVDTSGTVLDEGAARLSQNPLGKIPSLSRDDGPTIYDSRVICRYLDVRAGGVLYPDGNRLWDVLTLEATADGIMEGILSAVYEARVRPAEKQFQPWIDAQIAKSSRAIAAVNERWMSHLLGPLDMGQIAIACSLGYCDFRQPELNWRNGNDALAKWFEGFSERASFQATAPVA